MIRVRTLLAVALSLFSSTAAFALGPGAIIQYVNPMSRDGGDGSTPSIDPTNPSRAFSSLKHWEAQNLDLVALGSSMTVICKSTQTELDTTIPFDIRYDTSPLSISGWTTGATNQILIIPDAFSMHLGTPTGHGYKNVPTNIPGNVWSYSDGNVIVDGLTVVSSGTNGGSFPSMINIGGVDANTTNYILNCIFGMTLDGNETEARGLYGSNTNVKTFIVQNNLFLAPKYNQWRFGGTWINQQGEDGFARCAGMDSTGNTVYFYNNTCAEGWYTGYEGTAGVFIAKNSIFQNTSNNAFAGCDAASFNNIGDDATTCGGGTITNSSVAFRNGHSHQDWHLANTDTVAQSKCVSLSTDTAFAYAWDIEGGTRTTSAGLTAWDCGCDEVGTDRVTVGAGQGGGGGGPSPARVPSRIKFLDYIIESKSSKPEDSLGRTNQ